jgi:hypothetical protein
LQTKAPSLERLDQQPIFAPFDPLAVEGGAAAFRRWAAAIANPALKSSIYVVHQPVAISA